MTTEMIKLSTVLSPLPKIKLIVSTQQKIISMMITMSIKSKSLRWHNNGREINKHRPKNRLLRCPSISKKKRLSFTITSIRGKFSPLRKNIRGIKFWDMGRSMPARKKMTHLFSRNIRIYCRKRRNATRPSEMRNSPSAKNTNKWDLASSPSKRPSTTKHVKNSKKTRLKTRTTKVKVTPMTTSNPSSKSEDSTPLNPSLPTIWPSKSKPMWWRKWRNASSPEPR
jgi:hypothetical protein